jgi:Tol biopolymer transport system component
MSISRRDFVARSFASSFLLSQSIVRAEGENRSSLKPRLFFTSQGKTGLASSDGTELKYLNFQKAGQATWQPGACFSDGRRVVVLSMEPRRDGPGRPFEEYYTQTPTHLWQYDLTTDSLEEICTQDRIAPFTTPALLLSDDRLLIQVVKNKVGQIYSVRLDGSDAREFTKAGEGLPYGLSLRPDGKRVAFHLASPQGYQVWASDLEGRDRIRIAAQPGHLYFGTQWSPDGQWVLYVDCLYQQDPGHDWADVCIGRGDGSEHKVLTTGQSMWFAATYGNPKTRGGGSNVPCWTTDGQILFPRRTKDAKVAWAYRVNQPDLDHFNRDYQPELARGGSQICRMNPKDGTITELTAVSDQVWDFRASQSTDGKQIVFCRAATGEAPAIWVMDNDGKNGRMITRGIDDLGADHPRWIPST